MISKVQPSPAPFQPSALEPKAPVGAKSFKEMLSDAFESVNDAQLEAEAAVKALALGDVRDLHQVTLAMEKADLTLQLAIRVRNKAIEAYQEISRMQI